jgi:1-aminocyclopropane-1-carboxylate deaminase
VRARPGIVDWPDAVYDKVGNILLSRLAGADVRLVKAGFGIGFKESWENAIAEIEAAGGRPYVIPAGASDHPLGGLGFAGWAGEVAVQETELGVFFDTVVVCSVTGSTQAGMVAGFALAAEQGARPRRVLGVDASAKPVETRDQVLRIARRTGALIGCSASSPRTTSSWTSATTPGPTASPTARRWTRCGWPRGPRG